MKLTATIIRFIEADMQAELRDIERAVTSGTREAGRGLKTELRRQVGSAGLGQRLAGRRGLLRYRRDHRGRSAGGHVGLRRGAPHAGELRWAKDIWRFGAASSARWPSAMGDLSTDHRADAVAN